MSVHNVSDLFDVVVFCFCFLFFCVFFFWGGGGGGSIITEFMQEISCNGSDLFTKLVSGRFFGGWYVAQLQNYKLFYNIPVSEIISEIW